MHIIILEGNQGTGKTTTLQMVFAFLRIFGARVITFALLQKSKKDFEALLSYQKKTVAIYSRGDNNSECYKAINKFASARKKVDVLILAHRASNNPLNIQSPPFTSKIIYKSAANTLQTDQMQTNLLDCKLTITHI